MSSYLQDLESYCIVFSITTDNEKRKAAENHIQKYKKTYSIDAFTFVLNNTTNEMLMYETLAAFSDTIINNWSDYVVEAQTNSGTPDASSEDYRVELKPTDRLNEVVYGLLNWVIENQSRLSHSVWYQAITVIVKIIKKSYSEKITIFLEEFMKKVNQYFTINDLKNRITALEMVSGLLEVFSSLSVTNQQLKISRNSELKLRNEFEKKYLSDIFLLFLNLLDNFMSTQEFVNGDESEIFLKCLLTNMETILSWNFINKVQAMKLQILPKNEACKRFCPPTKWSNIITDFSIIDFLFKVHNKVRSNCQLGLLTMSCLNQIAGLKVKFRHNSVIDTELETGCYRFSHVDFSFAFIDSMCRFFNPNDQQSNIEWHMGKELYDYEVPLVADMIYQLQEHLNNNVWLDGLMLYINDKNIPLDNDRNIPKYAGEEYGVYIIQKLQQFIHFFARFCLKCIDGSASEKISKSETIYIETEDRVLSRFVSFTNFHEYLFYVDKISTIPDPNFMSTNDWDRLIFQQLINISNYCHNKLFEHFLQAHLAAPEGFRNVTPEHDIVIIESDDDDLDLDIEEDDKKKFESGLYASGFSALQCINESLRFLTGLLHERMIHMEHVFMSSENPSFSLLEDLHWIVSIIGYTIFNVTDDLITSNRMIYTRHVDCSEFRALYEHSRSQLKSMVILDSNKQETIDRIVKQYQTLLMNVCTDIDRDLHNVCYSFDVNLNCCDDIIRLFFITLRATAFSVRCCESGQLMADLIWLLNRWMLGYIQMLDDCDNPELNDVVIVAVFARQEAGKLCRQNIINTCLKIITSCIEKWNQDPIVMQAVVTLMLNIAGSMSIARLLLTSNIWMNEMTRRIVNAAPPFNGMNDELFSQMITSVLSVASAASSEEQLHNYLGILNPIGTRLSKLFSSDLNKITETEIITCLAFIRGMVMTKWPSRLSSNSSEWSMNYRKLFDTLYPWLEKSVDILCKNYLHCPAIIQSLLESFLEICKTMLLELTHSQSTQFYNLNLNVFKLYSDKTFNNITKEETVTEIKYIFTIASDLLTRQVFDEFDFDDSNVKEELQGYDVIAQLIHQLAPFIPSDVLEVPEVGTAFFHCISLVTEFKASAFLLKMDYDFNRSLLQLLNDSISNSNSSISLHSLRSIISLASDYYVWRSDSKTNEECQMKFSLTNEFNCVLKKIMAWLRSGKLSSEMLDTVSSALISLVKLDQGNFIRILTEWLESLNNPFVSNKIQVILNSMELEPPIGSSISLFNRYNIEKWIEFVQLINNYGDL